MRRMQQVKVGKVVSSQWCRCKQTAELMNIGAVEDAPTFNNAFVLNTMRDELTAGARTMIDAWRGPGTLGVVTHGENILLMLGLRPREAEVIVVAPDPTSQKDAAHRPDCAALGNTGCFPRPEWQLLG